MTKLNLSADLEAALAQLRRYDFCLQSDVDSFFSFSEWSPTFGGFSVNPKGAHRFTTLGKICVCVVAHTTSGTSNGVSFTMSAPVQAANIPNGYWGSSHWVTTDNGVDLATPGKSYIQGGSGIITLNSNSAGGAWTAANGKRAFFTLIYEID